MPDIPQTASSTLPQTLEQVKQTSQLNQLPATSDAARQTIEVVVRQLSGNLVNLSRTRSLLSKPAILPQPVIQGNLINGAAHTVKASLENAPVLEFFSATGPTEQKGVQLSEQQIQTLLKLPPKQLVASIINAQNSAIQKLATISATVLSNEPVNSDTANNKVDTNKLTSHILKIQLTKTPLPIELTLPNKQTAQLNTGEKVTLSLTPKEINWQLTVQPQAKPQHQPASQVNLSKQLLGDMPKKAEKQVNKVLEKVPAQNFLIPPKEAVNIVKAVLIESSKNKTGNIELAVKQVLQHLTKENSAENKKLAETIQKQPIDKLNLHITPDNKIQLQLETNKPVSTIPITREIAQALAPLKLPNQQSIIKLANQLPPTEKSTSPAVNKEAVEQITQETKKQSLVKAILQLGDSAKRVLTGQSSAPLFPPKTNPSTKQLTPSATEQTNNITRNIEQANQGHKKTNVADKPMPVVVQASLDKSAPSPQDRQVKNNNTTESLTNAKPSAPKINKETTTQVELKQLAEKLILQVQTAPIESSVITSKLLTNKNQQHQLIQQLLRIVQAKAETPSLKLQSIENMLTDVEFTKISSEVSSKQIIEQVLQQTKAALPQGKEVDAQNIKHLLSSPALNLSAKQLLSSNNNQGLISGLVTLLQVSLSSRIARNQNSRSDLVARALHSVLPLMGKTKPNVTAKSLTEFSQLEQKHQLMREIGRMLSGHQANKLASAEQMLQGQESFYYNLPTMMGGIFKDAELLIKREENQEQQNEADKGNNQTWQLTMKLSVGELGELLTKAKLRPDNVELNFYASNDAVKIQVMNYLPLFKRKLESLGIEVSKSDCQLGKIPDSLQQRPYHVFQTKV